MARNLRLVLGGLTVLGGCFVVGCNDGSEPAQRPIDSTAATATANQRIDELIVGLADSTAALDTTGSTTLASGSVNTALGSGSGCGTSSGPASTVDDGPKSTAQALDDLLHQIGKAAKEQVFREDLVEVKDGNQVIYKVDVAAACGTSSTCIDNLTRNPIRFAVTANTDDSLNVSLLIGDARHKPATAVLAADKLSLRGDLAEVKDTLRLFMTTDQQANLPEQLSGVLESSIEKRAAGEFVISSSVLEKVDVLVGQAKGKPVAVTVQPSSPSTQLTINSHTNTIGYAVNWAAVDVQVAGAAVCNSRCGMQEKTGTFSGHLAGYTGEFAFTQGATELTFSGVGLGNDTSYVALNGDRLGTLDVNPTQGRKLNVTFKKTAQGTLVTFDPALDIKLALMLNKLSDSLRVDMPAWLSNEIFEVLLGGPAKPSVLVPSGGCSPTGSSATKNQLQVVSGELKLMSSSLATPVDVSAGMCLVPLEGSDSNANPMSRLKAAACQ